MRDNQRLRVARERIDQNIVTKIEARDGGNAAKRARVARAACTVDRSSSRLPRKVPGGSQSQQGAGKARHGEQREQGPGRQVGRRFVRHVAKDGPGGKPEPPRIGSVED